MISNPNVQRAADRRRPSEPKHFNSAFLVMTGTVGLLEALRRRKKLDPIFYV
jgi:hypothetical protein